MIQVPKTELEHYKIIDEKDSKYKQLILDKLIYINSNSNKIIKYANTVYN